MLVDANVQLLAYTVPVAAEGEMGRLCSRRRVGGRKRDVAEDAVAVVAGGAWTKVVCEAIERRSHVVGGV